MPVLLSQGYHKYSIKSEMECVLYIIKGCANVTGPSFCLKSI